MDIRLVEANNAESNHVMALGAVSAFSLLNADAVACRARAETHLQRCERWYACVRTAGAPDSIVNGTGSMLDPARKRLDAAKAVEKATADALGVAKALEHAAGKDRQGMGQLVGPWYGGTGTAAAPKASAGKSRVAAA